MILQGDCLEVLATLPENSVDTCITDPPYELGFMGKKWDSSGIAFQPETWQAVYRVLKPGALLLAFGGTRTYHRMVCAIEDAGFEIRDMVEWVYGSGFPKSHDISKAIDKMAGAERTKVIGRSPYEGRRPNSWGGNKNGDMAYGDYAAQPEMPILAPSTPEAQLWDGWGTTLKPAHEPIVVAMKPVDGNFVNNALTWGVAGYWIDGGRVGSKPRLTGTRKDGDEINANPSSYLGSGTRKLQTSYDERMAENQLGRFPANLIHDGSDEVVELFPQSVSTNNVRKNNVGWGTNGIYGNGAAQDSYGYSDSGSAARFFYCAKASRSERNAGLEGMELRDASKMSGGEETRQDRLETGLTNHPQMQNHHPTVKPIALMRYLVRLTKTPTGGVVLDPFMGSGTTGIACVLEGREFIGIEREPEYVEIAEKRIAHYRLPIMDEVGA